MVFSISLYIENTGEHLDARFGSFFAPISLNNAC